MVPVFCMVQPLAKLRATAEGALADLVERDGSDGVQMVVFRSRSSLAVPQFPSVNVVREQGGQSYGGGIQAMYEGSFRLRGS